MDKFYLLFRRFTNAAFRLLARQGWEEDNVSQFTSLLTKEGGPLCANDVKVPDGITYHLADIYVEELDKAVEVASQAEDYPFMSVPALRLLQPFITTMAICHSPLVFDRISKAVIHPFLEDCLTLQEAEEKGDNPSNNKRKANSQKRNRKRRKDEGADAKEASSDEGDDESEKTDGCQYAYLMDQMGATGKAMTKAIFDAIFQAASAKNSIEARRRRMYKLCKDEEERLEEEEEEGY